MSHFSRLNTKIRDGELLVRCLKEAGYKVELDTTIKGYEGMRSVEIAVRLPKGYDVGFVRAGDGSYQILGDWWGVRDTSQSEFVGAVDERVGAIQQQLKREAEELERKMRREYALEKTLKQLKEQGFQVAEQVTEEDGTVRLMARRWR